MRFTKTPLFGAFVIALEPYEDERGFFGRTFCAREFHEYQLETKFVQCNLSSNRKAGTIRGIHYQRHPSAEAKLVRCTAGALFDLIVDIRPESSTYLQNFGLELTAGNHLALYIPKGFAHGFQTLEDNTEVFYQMSEFYAPDTATGIRFDDPRLGINWPLPVTSISEKDQSWPYLS